MALIWTQGTTAEGCPLALQRRDGSAVSLSGAQTIAVYARRVDGGSPSTFTVLTGVATVDDATNGKFTFKFSPGDVANPGRYQLYAHVDYGNGNVYNSDATEFLVVSGS